MARRNEVAFGAAGRTTGHEHAGIHKSEVIVSPSLIKKFDPSHPIPAKFQIGWEELMGVAINPAHYTGLNNEEYNDLDAEMDALLAEASQRVERELNCAIVEEKLRSLDKENMNSITVSRFGPLQSEDDIKQVKESHVPKNTLKNTSWALQIWQQWAIERLQKDPESISDFVLIVCTRFVVDYREQSELLITLM